jgi:hypothetical protein
MSPTADSPYRKSALFVPSGSKKGLRWNGQSMAGISVAGVAA